MCFITAGPITKLFAWGGEESGGHVLSMRDDEPRPVWMSLLITHWDPWGTRYFDTGCDCFPWFLFVTQSGFVSV